MTRKPGPSTIAIHGAPHRRPDWTPVWSEEAERLPNAIRIRTRTEFGGAGWPDLFFNLRSGDAS